MTITVAGSTITFSDGTTQSTATSGSAVTTITYDNRGSLRSLTPSSNLAIQTVDSLGLFTYFATGQAEPDDDETAFLVNGGPGVWLLTSPSVDIIRAYDLPDIEYISAKVG
jgi:carboxypeptidase C (cathepsin A)